eukprot:9025219-Lingulodinium_polyedra.AAC.1
MIVPPCDPSHGPRCRTRVGGGSCEFSKRLGVRRRPKSSRGQAGKRRASGNYEARCVPTFDVSR